MDFAIDVTSPTRVCDGCCRCCQWKPDFTAHRVAAIRSQADGMPGTVPIVSSPERLMWRKAPAIPSLPRSVSYRRSDLMGTMQLLLNDVESHFGLSDAKAGSLLSSVLGLIQEQNGGLSGFLDRFRRAGLSDAV